MCSAGVCGGGTETDCDDDNEGTADLCAEPDGCTHEPISGCGDAPDGGCGCVVPGASRSTGDPLVWMLLLGGLLIVRRRR